MGHDVFVSHSAKDKPTADAVCAVMEAQGIRCWVAPRDIVPGKDWGESIVDAIKGARVMVLVFSTHANDSHQIKREVERAVNKGIPVIPLRIEDIEPKASLEYFLSTPHWLDAFTPPLEKHLQYLAQIIRSIIGGTLVVPASVPPEAKNKPEAAAIKTEPATRTPQPISPTPSQAGEKRKVSLLAMAIVALILACLGGWYFGVYQPEQKHQAELAQLKADAERLRVAREKQAEANRAAELKQAADAKAQTDAEIARQAEANRQAEQTAAEEKTAKEKQAADAKAQTDAEIARQAEANRQAEQKATEEKTAKELAAKQSANAKTKADAEAVRQTAPTTTNNQTHLESRPSTTLSKLSLSDFNAIFGFKIGAKTDEVRGIFGAPNSEDAGGGSFGDQDLVWTYQAGGTEKLKIVFDNQTKVVRSITVDENHLLWLAAKPVSDPKLSLLGMPIGDIEKLIGQPTWNSTSTFLYEEKGLGVEFFCPEYNGSKCFRIVINWVGQ